MAARQTLPQQWRVWIALGYLAVLVAVANIVQGSVLPPTDINGLWFYAAFAGLLLGRALTEPFFSTPADSIANGVALALALLSSTQGLTATTADFASIGRIAMAVYAACLIVTGVLAVTWKDRSDKRGRIGTFLARLLRLVGNSGLVFGIALWVSAYAAFADDSLSMITVLGTWAIIFVARPLERAAAAWRRRKVKPNQNGSARVEEFHDPGLLIAIANRDATSRLGDVVRDASGRMVGRVVDIDRLGTSMQLVVAIDPEATVSLGDRLIMGRAEGPDRAIGYVGRGSEIDEIRVRSSADGSGAGLREGRLLAAQLGAARVYFQVTAAEIRRDEASEMSRDILDVSARKVGTWDSDLKSFLPVAWIPAPGAVVEITADDPASDPDASAIGRIPGSNFLIPIDVHAAVTHNTAILGILGIGKTTLAFEMIRRMLVEGINVVVLDITDQYAEEFIDTWPADDQESTRVRIESAIAEKVNDDRPRGEEAGNLEDFHRVVREILDDLNTGPGRLLILNPAGFEVTRRDGGLNYTTRRYPLAHLTIVEVTRVVAEEMLNLAQSTRADVEVDDNGQLVARFCLVLEEAHSLVPEWNSAVDKAEQHGTNATVRAILQGRKFGFGCLLLTQRTANVTKSILNQCNTVVAMQIFDSTGMDFLRNYIGDTHARLLAALEPFHAVIFGRAFSTRIPLVVKLNHKDQFEADFWAERARYVPETRLSSGAVAVATVVAETINDNAPAGDIDPHVDFIPADDFDPAL